MRYENIVKGKFIERPNRFIALVDIDGNRVKAHVKNTGRLGELLVAGAEVYLEDHESRMGRRKLRYSLIGVRKETPGGMLKVNVDSQAPNKAVKEALQSGKLLPEGVEDIAVLKAEYKYGNSRLDFYGEDSCGNKFLMEVKGVTLEDNGKCRFPDAPTERGIKHVEELTAAVKKGYKSCVVFVIQMKGALSFEPNYDTHRQFGEALAKAAEAGVEVTAWDCIVEDDAITIDEQVKVIL